MNPSMTGGGAALGNTQIMSPPVVVRANKNSRRVRFNRRKKSSELLLQLAGAEGLGFKELPRVARCGWTFGDTAVRVCRSLDGERASFKAVETCSSVWACPPCSAIIRAQRSAEIVEAVKNWQKAGNSVVFVTLTVRHSRNDFLQRGLHAVAEGFRQLIKPRSWQVFKRRWGISGYVRSIETTYGINGWHPHVHALFFLEGKASKDVESAFSGYLGEIVDGVDPATGEIKDMHRWASIVSKLGGRIPNEVHGYDVQLADENGLVLAKYLAKLQEKTDLGAEIARFDIKTGSGTSVTPFELLDDHNQYKHKSFDLWNEYVHTTRGRRAITWSKGMRELAGLSDEISDDEVLQAELEEYTEEVFCIPPKEYRSLTAQGKLTVVLELVEAGEIEHAKKFSGGFTVTFDPNEGRNDQEQREWLEFRHSSGHESLDDGFTSRQVRNIRRYREIKKTFTARKIQAPLGSVSLIENVPSHARSVTLQESYVLFEKIAPRK